MCIKIVVCIGVYSGCMVSKRINCTIEEEMWKECMLNSVSPSHALRLGAEMLLGSSNEKKIIKNKLKNLEIKLKFYKQRLGEIEKVDMERRLTEEKKRQRALDKQKFIKDNENSFKIAAKILAREKYSFGSVYEYWNKLNAKYKDQFGEPFQQKDFVERCKEMIPDGNAPKQP